MSGELDPRLAALPSEPGGNEQRFYPPGEHPATRQMLALLDFMAAIDPDGVATSELAEHIRSQIAAFEESEAEAKQAALRLLDRWDADGGPQR